MNRLVVSAFVLALFSGGWVVQPSGTRASFRGLSVVDAKTVWVSGSRAKFLRTTNGGTTWKLDSIAGADSLDLRDIQAFDAKIAVALSAGPAEKGQAKIFRTTDGGAAGIFSVAFIDANHGIVVGGNYSQPKTPYVNVALTSDGGATWRAAAGPTPPGYLSAVTYVPGASARTLVATGLVGTAVSLD